jgi:hypothetical protein
MAHRPLNFVQLNITRRQGKTQDLLAASSKLPALYTNPPRCAQPTFCEALNCAQHTGRRQHDSCTQYSLASSTGNRSFTPRLMKCANHQLHLIERTTNQFLEVFQLTDCSLSWV